MSNMLVRFPSTFDIIKKLLNRHFCHLHQAHLDFDPFTRWKYGKLDNNSAVFFHNVTEFPPFFTRCTKLLNPSFQKNLKMIKCEWSTFVGCTLWISPTGLMNHHSCGTWQFVRFGDPNFREMHWFATSFHKIIVNIYLCLVKSELASVKLKCRRTWWWMLSWIFWHRSTDSAEMSNMINMAATPR